MLSRGIVEAPNKTSLPGMVKDEKRRAKYDETWAQSWQQPVGPPTASLAVAVMEPGDYSPSYKIDLKTNAKGGKYLSPDLRWEKRAQTSAVAEPKGTILILHGYRDAKECMMHWALFLAQNGYRCVLVDFRGHGRSSGDWIGFGAFEVADLRQVIDALEVRKLLAGRLGVIGVSYGGSVGLGLAARDSRVAAVVALEPFSNAQKAVEEFAQIFAKKYVKDWTADDYARVYKKAAKKADFSWEKTDVLAAVDQLRTPVFLIHGEKDRWISPEHSKLLDKALKGEHQLLLLPEDDHLVLSIRLMPIADDVGKFFGKHLR
jgi:pimeloyl-ACP methyl ester carboxylesterase